MIYNQIEIEARTAICTTLPKGNKKIKNKKYKSKIKIISPQLPKISNK